MLLSPFCFIIRTLTQNGLRPTFSILDYLQRYICYVVAPTIAPSRFALKLAWYNLYRFLGTKKTQLLLYNFENSEMSQRKNMSTYVIHTGAEI